MRGLSFGDGFQFGCGFFAAWILASIMLGLLVVILGFVATLLGLGGAAALLHRPGGALILALLSL
jgi:hypothetical protein